MKSITWKDGSAWRADEPTFRRATAALAALGDVVVGLGPVVHRWVQLAATHDRVNVDDVAPSEDARAVLTAGLARALEDARAAGPEALGFDDAEQYARYLEQLGALHELFVTDVTYQPSDVRGR